MGMAKGSTLLHYVLGHATPEAHEAFNKIVAADKNSLIKLLDSYHNRREDNKGFLHNFFRGGKPQDPLHLDPSELERLSQVYRDPAQQTSFDITLNGSELIKPLKGEEIKTILNKFYNDNKLDFDKSDNIDYNIKNQHLHYEGRKDVAEQLLNQLGMKPKLIRPIVYKEDAEEGTELPQQHVNPNQTSMTYRIGLDQLEPSTVQEIKNSIKAWGTQYPGTPIPQVISKGGKPQIEFKGDRAHLEFFLSKLGMSQNSIERIIQSADKV